jgi:transposase-like protein
VARGWRRHSVEEIAEKLERVKTRTAKGATVSDAIAAEGIASATYFRWRKLYSGLSLHQIAYVRDLEHEVARLRERLAAIEQT